MIGYTKKKTQENDLRFKRAFAKTCVKIANLRSKNVIDFLVLVVYSILEYC